MAASSRAQALSCTRPTHAWRTLRLLPVFGLAPTVKVDVRRHCPHGVVAVREEITFLDGLFANLTLGIWTPRSSWYYCASEESS